jgi:cytochrome c peroxidase
MPDDLHRARRRGLAVRELIATVALATGCSRAGPAVPDAPVGPEVSDVGPAPSSAATLLLRRFDHDGEEAVDALTTGCDDRAAYLALRRSALGLLSLWRRRLPMAAEAAFGPEIAIQEAGGSIGALDRAMQAHDCSAVRAAASGLGGALRVTELSLTAADVPRVAFAQALSDAAYRLGQAVLESTPYVPDGDDAALADVLGLLEFVDAGAQALGLDVRPELAPLEGIRGARTLGEVRDRATLVRASGVAGAALRRALRALPGEHLAPDRMYRTLDDAPDIAALTLPQPALPVDPERAALGRRLFSDRRLSRGGGRACATCHVPGLAYADGLVAPISLDPTAPLRRNTPTLLYSPLEARLTWDGRVRTADRQALMVLHTRAEMGSSDVEMTRAVEADPAYARGFRAAFDGGVTPQDIGRALAAFEASALVRGSAPIDRFARGDDAALSTDARAGLDVFAGKGRCARCHVPPVFGGSRPPDFTAPVFAILGVPAFPGARAVDADMGRGDGAFRTPTVRNIDRTAPYFHNGRYATLDQVVDFYDRGGGRGLGLSVPNEDPEIRPLTLSPEDKRVLLVFMRDALTDDSR